MRTPDTIPVRRGEEIDVQSLARYLRGKIDGFDGPLEIEQFPGGHSNLTFLLKCEGREYVLRRPPIGPVPPKAHDMAREYRVLRALGPHFAPAPRVYLLCEEPSVIGGTFFLMERRQGIVIRREAPPCLTAHHCFQSRVSEAFVDALAELHSIRIHDHGLDRLGRPEGFLERQVAGWRQRWDRAQTEPLAEMDHLGRWLAEKLPASPAAAIVHNDYKLDNLMLDPDEPGRIVAVLDWEMATVGDPLVDLGIVLCYWPQADDPAMRREAISPVTTQPGWPPRQQLLKRYHQKTSRDLTNIAYYEVFGIFKLAVVLQQIYYRFCAGQTRDERFRDFDKRVRGLAEAAVVVMGNAD